MIEDLKILSPNKGKKPNVNVLEGSLSKEKIDRIQNKHFLPDQYVKLLTELGIIALNGEQTNITFCTEGELEEMPYDLLGNELKNIFIFGTDNGGWLYFFNLPGDHNYGKDAVYLIYPGDGTWVDAQVIGQNLFEVLQKIIGGEDFQESPYLEN